MNPSFTRLHVGPIVPNENIFFMPVLIFENLNNTILTSLRTPQVLGGSRSNQFRTRFIYTPAILGQRFALHLFKRSISFAFQSGHHGTERADLFSLTTGCLYSLKDD